MNQIEHLNQTAAKAHAQPEEILAALAIRPGEAILEIGVGGGWYAERFAQTVGSDGYYYGLDTHAEFIEHLQQLRTQYPQIDGAHIAPGGVPDTEWRFDRIFSRNVYHHLQHRSAYFAALGQFLKPSGELIVIDFNRPHGTHDQPHHYTVDSVLLEEMQQAGFVLKQQHDFLFRQLFMVFQIADKR